MNKIALLLAVATISGCSTVENVRYGKQASTPIPTEELTAIGSHSTKGGSYEVAMEQADGFCKRWRAAPSIVRKQLKYNGTLTEDTNTAINTATDVARAAGAWIPGIGNNDAYETTLTYKCY